MQAGYERAYLVRRECYFMRDRLSRHRSWARSGEADVQAEVPEPQVEYSAAGAPGLIGRTGGDLKEQMPDAAGANAGGSPRISAR
jgi:hypothetical protein